MVEWRQPLTLTASSIPGYRWLRDRSWAQGSLEVLGPDKNHQPTTGPPVSNSAQVAEYQPLQSHRPGAQEVGFLGRLDSVGGK